MHYGLLGTYQGIKSLPYYMFPRLGQYLNRHVIGDKAVIYQFSEEFELGLRSCGEAHLYLLEADVA